MKFILSICALLVWSAIPAQKTYVPADADSRVHFTIKNFGINTGGQLSGLKGKIIFDAKKLKSSSVDVSTDVATIDTDNEKRDEHLKTADFFDATQFPVINIKSTQILQGKDLKHFIFKGTVTIKSVTKPISFPFTAEAVANGAMFTGDFEISRADFGIGKSSGVMADKVKVSLSVLGK